MSDGKIQLSIPSELTHVRLIGAAVRSVLSELRCGEDKIAEVELCVVEAINNAIEHAYREERGHTVDLEIVAQGGELEMSVSDAGIAMPAGTLERARAAAAARDEAAAMDVPELAEGGYGLGLIQQLMDRVRYVRDGEKNTLTMSLRLVHDSSRRDPAAE
jgi:serine/threonine-protein kinase RsbW